MFFQAHTITPYTVRKHLLIHLSRPSKYARRTLQQDLRVLDCGIFVSDQSQSIRTAMHTNTVLWVGVFATAHVTARPHYRSCCAPGYGSLSLRPCGLEELYVRITIVSSFFDY